MRSIYFAILLATTVHAGELVPGDVYKGEIASVVSRGVGEEAVSSFSADFNFDGKHEIVIQCLCGNAGCENYIFEVLSRDEYRFMGNAFFHTSAFYVERDPATQYGSITAYHRLNVEEGCIVRYLYTSRGFEKSKGARCGKDAFEEFTRLIEYPGNRP